MGRLSRKKLDKSIEHEVFKLFWSSITKLHGADEAASFFSDLLTETEEVMLAKRFACAILLLRGKRPVEITKTLHITYTTIGSVSSWVKNIKPPTQKVMKRIIEEQDWQALLDRIDEVLYRIPAPLRTTHWSAANKAKYQHEIDQKLRNRLR